MLHIYSNVIQEAQWHERREVTASEASFLYQVVLTAFAKYF